MEADLLTIYGADLPEAWQRFVSLRRLLVIVRHLPVESAVGRALGEWPLWWDLLDDIRRAQMVAIKGNPDPHPERPAARRQAEAKAERAAKRRRSIEESREREARRQARLRAEGGEP